MEKDIALREWCIEKAIVLLLSNETAIKFDTDDVIKIAKALEAFILKGK